VSVRIESIPEVAEVTRLLGARARAPQRPDLVLEVPHGATRAAHFDALAARLVGPFPADLRDFFFVNTDVGAPEAALEVARRVVARESERTALVVRCLVPRTFVDTNRIIDPAAAATTSRAGQMTPGIVSYVKDPRDLATLLERHGAYRRLVEAAFESVCGHGGRGVMLHSYAPREVDVPVDERIVERLHAAYQPDQVERWPLRSEVDLITTAPDGVLLADAALAERVRAAYGAADVAVAENKAYHLHPSTVAHSLALRHPGRTLCLELRRDLLVRAFTPFSEMHADPARIARMAAPLAAALAHSDGR
jgi:hypothetical protein